MDITPILQAAFALLAAIITAAVVPCIKAKTTASQQAQINALVQIAVAAAEQIYAKPGKGEVKKEYVVNWLREHGVTVDAKQLNVMIEAAVYELKNGFITIGEPVTESEGAYGNG